MKARQLARRTLAMRLTTGRTLKPTAPDAPELPIMGYPIQVGPPLLEKESTSKVRGRRKRPFSGVRIRIMAFYVRELQACAEAVGWRFDAFLYHALLDAKNRVAEQFGVSSRELEGMSAANRRRLAGQFQAVSKCHMVMWHPPARN